MSVSEIRHTSGMRVLIGADTFAPNVNGAARFAERLTAGLAARGHEIHVVCPSTSDTAGSEAFHGARVHRVRSRKIPVHDEFRICLPWRAKEAVERILDEVRPDVVHAQAHFLIGRALIHGARRRGIPIVATNHFMPENLLAYSHLPKPVHRTAMRLAWRDLGRVFAHADIVTTPTERAAKVLRENGFPGPVRAVSCGIDAESYVGNGQTVPGTVLFVGRLDREKHVDELLAAVAGLDDSVRVELIGEGACRAELEEQAHRLDIAERVSFHGFVSERRLREAYARAQVFCMPGVAELQSLATLEAMSAGKPVVAANAVALPHLVREGHNGWLYEPGEIEQLSDRLRRVLEEPDGGAKLGTASRQLVAKHAMSTTLEHFEELYAELLDARRPWLPVRDRSLVA